MKNYCIPMCASIVFVVKLFYLFMMNKINYTFPDFMQYLDHHFLYMSNRKWSSRK